jgi:hypothetical protein
MINNIYDEDYHFSDAINTILSNLSKRLKHDTYIKVHSEKNNLKNYKLLKTTAIRQDSFDRRVHKKKINSNRKNTLNKFVCKTYSPTCHIFDLFLVNNRFNILIILSETPKIISVKRLSHLFICSEFEY